MRQLNAIFANKFYFIKENKNGKKIMLERQRGIENEREKRGRWRTEEKIGELKIFWRTAKSSKSSKFIAITWILYWKCFFKNNEQSKNPRKKMLFQLNERAAEKVNEIERAHWMMKSWLEWNHCNVAQRLCLFINSLD